MHALIIDDDAVVRMLASKILESKGFSVTALKSEEEVISYMADPEAVTHADLVLLDLQIGNCTGKEIYEHLRGKFTPFPKLVFISSNTEEEAKQLDLMNSEGNAFLQKPFQAGSLFEVLAQIGVIE
jgi:two-component system, cell cycle sensor histidine kinase and response regulator CckA